MGYLDSVITRLVEYTCSQQLERGVRFSLMGVFDLGLF